MRGGEVLRRLLVVAERQWSRSARRLSVWLQKLHPQHQSTIHPEVTYAISSESEHPCRGRERGGEGRETRLNNPVYPCGSETRGRLFHSRQGSTHSSDFP